jgi:adenosylmethionine-8-amino-7-oxononanoate aminotransferase
VLRHLTATRLFERVVPMGKKLTEVLAAVAGRHAMVGEVRGAGLLAGLELVADPVTRQPFEPSRETAARLAAATFDAGVVTYPVAGTLEGCRGDFLLVGPPFTIQDEHIELIGHAIGQGLGLLEQHAGIS